MKRKSLQQRAERAANKAYPDMPHLGAYTQNQRQRYLGFQRGYLAGYRAAKRKP